jgi:hypothetical protein
MPSGLAWLLDCLGWAAAGAIWTLVTTSARIAVGDEVSRFVAKNHWRHFLQALTLSSDPAERIRREHERERR